MKINFSLFFRYFGNRFKHLNSLLIEENVYKIFEKFFKHEPDDRDLPYSLTVREIRRNLPATDEQGILQILKELRFVILNRLMSFSR